MTKRKKKRISEKMRRYNPQFTASPRGIPSACDRVGENEEGKGTGRKEERTVEKMEEMAWISRFYWIWRSVSHFYICSVLFSDFLGGISLCVLGLFKDPYKIQIMPILYGILLTIWSAKALIIFYPVLKAVIIALFEDRKSRFYWR